MIAGKASFAEKHFFIYHLSQNIYLSRSKILKWKKPSISYLDQTGRQNHLSQPISNF